LNELLTTNAAPRNQEIASKPELSEYTNRNYLLRIYDKLGLSSRLEVVLYAVSGTNSTPIPTEQ